MSKPHIEIWDTVGLGIIIEFPTGVMIANQTGGTSCMYSKTEGIYLPLANDYNQDTKEFLSPEIELTNHFQGAKYQGSGATNGIDLEDVEIISVIINKYGLSRLIKIDESRLVESQEAWIRIKINQDNNFELINGFGTYPLNGVLTWSNSD